MDNIGPNIPSNLIPSEQIDYYTDIYKEQENGVWISSSGFAGIWYMSQHDKWAIGTVENIGSSETAFAVTENTSQCPCGCLMYDAHNWVWVSMLSGQPELFGKKTFDT